MPPIKYGGVAQLGEHLLCKQGVIGSIPFISTTARPGTTKEVQGKPKKARETLQIGRKGESLEAGKIWAYSSAG